MKHPIAAQDHFHHLWWAEALASAGSWGTPLRSRLGIDPRAPNRQRAWQQSYTGKRFPMSRITAFLYLSMTVSSLSPNASAQTPRKFRVAVAGFMHESNSFNPNHTTLRDYTIEEQHAGE